LLDDKLWGEEDNESGATPTEDEVAFYGTKLDNVSETDIKNIMSIVDDRFQIESKESIIGKAYIFQKFDLLNYS